MLVAQEVTAFEDPVARENQLPPEPRLQQSRIIANPQSEARAAPESQGLRDFADQPVFSSFHLSSSQEIPVATRQPTPAYSLLSESLPTCPLVQGMVLPTLFFEQANTGLTARPYKN
jgi:hypothetical protein